MLLAIQTTNYTAPEVRNLVDFEIGNIYFILIFYKRTLVVIEIKTGVINQIYNGSKVIEKTSFYFRTLNNKYKI